MRGNKSRAPTEGGAAASEKAEKEDLLGLGRDGEALFREILRSAGVIGNAGDGGGKVERKLIGLVVGLLQLVNVVEDAGNEVVDILLGNIVTDDDNRADGHGRGILGHVVSRGGNHVLAVVGRCGNQSVNMLVIQADKVNAVGGGERGDRGGGGAGNDEGGVNLAVLQGLGLQ